MLKKILLTVGATAATLGSGLALANPPYWAPAHGWRAHHQERYEERYERYHAHYRAPYYAYAPRPVYAIPAPRVVYAPPPPVVYPYYAAPAAVIAAPAFRPMAPGVSIRLRLPL